MGALFRLPHRSATLDELAAVVQGADAETWVTAMSGDAVASLQVAVPVAIVLGNEGAGVGDATMTGATRRVTIPIEAGVESLNVAVAAGIILQALHRPVGNA
jgi:TrmH family RNA methyltransferase